MSPTTAVSLSRMVDLALGSPELGAVNFNVLHSLLHAVLHRLDISDVMADLPVGEDGEMQDAAPNHDAAGGPEPTRLLQSRPDTAPDRAQQRDVSDMDSDSGVTGLASASETGVGERGKPVADRKDSKSIPIGRSPYHKLEEKVERLERQMTELNALPSTGELMQMVGGAAPTPDAGGSPKRPVAEMWQAMQLSRKVDANTQGVSKLMCLVEDLMTEMQKVQQQASADTDELRLLANKLQNLEKLTSDFEKRISTIPDPEFYNGFVTWTALEDALKGLKQQWDSMAHGGTTPAASSVPAAASPIHDAPASSSTSSSSSVPAASQDTPAASSSLAVASGGRDGAGREMSETGNQTDAISRPTSRHHSRTSTPGPSLQLQDLLERLGRLSIQHDELVERVERIESELQNKASREELQALGISAELDEQLRNMMHELAALKDAQGQDQTVMDILQKTLQQMQLDFDRLNKALQRLSDDITNQRSDIERIYGTCKELDDSKADKDYVLNEINRKADKEHLDEKVNCNRFDMTCDEINQMINDMLNKLLGTEGEWKNAMGQLSSEVDGKMDRLEFGPFRDELERQLRALASKLSALQNGGLSEDEAAGLRKQLIQRFHCISCDKPINVASQKPVPSLPAAPGLPENKSMRPYIAYDLDQIRQYGRGHSARPGGVSVDGVTDMYATARACGGSHTLTFPHRRITRLQHVSQTFPDEGPFLPRVVIDDQPSYATKAGRSAGKLPNVPVPQTSFERVNSARSQITPPSQSPHPPSAAGERPISSRVSARSLSAKPSTPTRVTFNQRSSTASPRELDHHSAWQQDQNPPRSAEQGVKIQLPQIQTEEYQSAAGDDMASPRMNGDADDDRGRPDVSGRSEDAAADEGSGNFEESNADGQMVRAVSINNNEPEIVDDSCAAEEGGEIDCRSQPAESEP